MKNPEAKPTLKDVFLLGTDQTFDRADFRVYAGDFLPRPKKAKAVKLQVAASIRSEHLWKTASVGDWLVVTDDGEASFLTDEEFKQQYERVKV